MDPAQPFAIQFQPPPPPPHEQSYPADIHPIPAVNPTPTSTFSPLPIPSHPPYSEMITAAIMWDNSQGKQGGSSKRAIEKYIDQVYNNLPPTHSALLSHHLKRLKISGQLVMLKNSYQLPSFAPPLPPVAVLSPPAQQLASPSQFQQSQFPPPQYQQPQQFQAHYQSQSPTAVAVDQSQYPAAVAFDHSATPKRKPGRPVKPKQSPVEQVVVPLTEPQASGSVSANDTMKRRGRPPKNQQVTVTTAEVPFFQPISQPVQKPVFVIVDNGEQLSSGEKRGRGRPKRKPEASPQQFMPGSEENVAENGSASAPKRRGRPRREVNSSGDASGGGSSLEMVAITPGVVGSSPRGRGTGRGRPRKNVVPGAVSAPVPSVNAGKKARGWVKGRPRGKKAPVGQAIRVALGLKRRGRPPKGTVGIVRQRRVSRTGKTLGRPRKNASIVGKQASEQAQWLLKKLEDMQLKIRDAVDTIRPSLVNQNTPDAWTALQQLEDLSTMPLTEAPTETAPPVSLSALPVSVSAPENVAPFSLNFPSEMVMTAPPTMNASFPFNVTEQMHAPGFGDHQPVSWIPSSGAQS